MATDYDRSLDNLMVVLRESEGAGKNDETLKPSGPAKATLVDGKEIEIFQAWYEFIADMHIRFVFDGPTSMRGLTADEFAALGLTPEEGVRVAVRNIKRVYGKPAAHPWSAGLMLVQGESPDLDSSYFLDREFWQRLSTKHPEGIVAGVPKRGGLLFAPVSDQAAIEGLRKGIAALFTSSENMRVSSALYLYKDDRWSVFQPPLTAR